MSQAKITFAKLIASPKFRKKLNSIKWRRWKAEHVTHLQDAKKRARIKRGQKKYAFEYMVANPGKFINQGEMLLYCDRRRSEDSNGKHKGYRDNSRSVEILRKDLLPLEWVEVICRNGIYFIYCPFIKEHVADEAWAQQKHKKDGFSKDQIKFAQKKAKYKCEITGLPASDGKLAADHWFPKEKGGKSEQLNCVILNKILNEKKNNDSPLTWFTKHLLTNFLNICKRMGDLDEIKEGLIAFIQEF